ncbi:hypothetical protein D3C78_1407320 [compost metagenome]
MHRSSFPSSSLTRAFQNNPRACLTHTADESLQTQEQALALSGKADNTPHPRGNPLRPLELANRCDELESYSAHGILAQFHGPPTNERQG